MQPKNVFKKLFSYLACNQMWLNFPMYNDLSLSFYLQYNFNLLQKKITSSWSHEHAHLMPCHALISYLKT
jgi:hypothetical protein